jgi:6-phosphogluconolactonase
MNRQIEIYPDMDSLSLAAANLAVKLLNEAVKQKGRAVMALTGGSSPGGMYWLLSQPQLSRFMPWGDLIVIWGDERVVPPDHVESNYRAWMQSGGKNWPLLPENLHPIPTRHGAEIGADAYEETLRKILGDKPALDLALFGMGADGHLASLFPNTFALNEEQRWVLPMKAPSHIEPQLPRITLALPLINRSRNVLFMTGGEAKAEVVQKVLSPKSRPSSDLPASLVEPAGELIWFLDSQAAGMLSE